MNARGKSNNDSGKPTPQKAIKKEQPTNDDPFAIDQAPTAKKVIQCASKPIKGRLHRVVCPMCDTQGFIPPAAVGRQVKCANQECLVPIFTAAESGASKPKAKVPARVSDDTASSEQQITKSGSAKNPIVIYGIVGTVLLAATIGLVTYLNRPGIDKLGALEPLPQKDFGNEDETDDETTPRKVVTPEVPQYRRRAIELVEIMVGEATITACNRDKAYCRRLAGDAYLKLGMHKQAAEEFSHMNKVAADARRSTEYYEIGPLVGEYWTKFQTGNTDGAAKDLKTAYSLAEKIPESGAVAFETGIALATALANSGDVSAATAVITKQQRDETITSQMDTVRLAAWSATSATLHDLNRPSSPPLQVFAWNEPLITAVGDNLAILGQWQSALAWCQSIDNTATAGDTFASVAEQMLQQNASVSERNALQAAAVAKGADIALRTQSVLAQKSSAEEQWAAVSAKIATLPAVNSTSLGSIESLIDDRNPDLTPQLLHGEAVTDFIIAALKNGYNEAASAGLQRLYATMTSVVAPTATVRAAAFQLDRNADDVQKRIATELRITNTNQIRSKFIAYRRGVDRVLKAAETRRLQLLLMLGRVIRHGGLELVKTAVTDTSTELAKEVGVDNLNGLLFVAAAEVDLEFVEMSRTDSSLNVPLARADPADETAVIRALISAWGGYLTTGKLVASNQLESAPKARGLCAATTRFITEKITLKASSSAEAIAEITKLKDKLWREECLQVATRTLVRNKLLEVGKVRPAVSEAATTPSQKIAAFYGAVLGAIDLENSQPKKSQPKKP